ncbi:MAG: hypothetical protein ABIB93_06880 [Chloroflexota bacterium]
MTALLKERIFKAGIRQRDKMLGIRFYPSQLHPETTVTEEKAISRNLTDEREIHIIIMSICS